MPMPIKNLDEFDKVVNVSWYTPEKSTETLRYASFTEEKTPLANSGEDSHVFSRFHRCILYVASTYGIS